MSKSKTNWHAKIQQLILFATLIFNNFSLKQQKPEEKKIVKNTKPTSRKYMLSKKQVFFSIKIIIVFHYVPFT